MLHYFFYELIVFINIDQPSIEINQFLGLMISKTKTLYYGMNHQYYIKERSKSIYSIKVSTRL